VAPCTRVRTTLPGGHEAIRVIEPRLRAAPDAIQLRCAILRLSSMMIREQRDFSLIVVAHRHSPQCAAFLIAKGVAERDVLLPHQGPHGFTR
jgi:hypothetical protein